MKSFTAPVAALVVWMLAGCASIERSGTHPPGDVEDASAPTTPPNLPDEYRDPRDPLESYNRSMHKFNTSVDEAVLQPLARGYRAITPEPVDRGITNFFANLRDVTSAANNLLQLKVERTATDVARFVTNSTIGLLGFIDVASELSLPSYKEDFGQTLGFWGLDTGPYLVLPLMGPKDLRDALGLIPDFYSQPSYYVDSPVVSWGLPVIGITDMRADLLEVSKAFDEAALDHYTFTRDAYLQKRLNDVYDGNPPDDFIPPDDGDP